MLWGQELGARSGKEHRERSARAEEVTPQGLKEANPWRILKM